MQSDLKLLDCTLRDGGYINDWRWGFQAARVIIQTLVKANIDIIEAGFLRNIEKYDPDITVCNHIEELNRLLPADHGKSIFSAMAMRSNYDINKLSPYSGKGIELIRITAHDYDIKEGMDFARAVQDKGYKLSINPINIMGYSDDKILWLIDQVNQIQAWQFSIVDTFGSMKRRDLDRIVSLADHNLDKNIRLALHLHENMSLSCSLAQTFHDKHLTRPTTIDASLMGMGRVPGNLPIELIADYLNEYSGRSYDIDYLMDAIEEYISPIKKHSEWGYMPAYFLSARFNLHRNYSEYYLTKGDLTNRDINHILARFDDSKKTAFDAAYAERLYEEYKDNRIDDSSDREKLTHAFRGRKILILAPGSTIVTHRQAVNDYIAREKPVIISVNFLPEDFPVDYAFFSNNKRFDIVDNFNAKIIITSNLSGVSNAERAAFMLDYNSLTGAFTEWCNGFIMLLQFLKSIGITNPAAAGADGFSDSESDYFSSAFRTKLTKYSKFNADAIEAMRSLEVYPNFITPSAYNVMQE